MQEDINSKLIILSNLNTDLKIERALINKLSDENEKLRNQINGLIKENSQFKYHFYLVIKKIRYNF